MKIKLLFAHIQNEWIFAKVLPMVLFHFLHPLLFLLHPREKLKFDLWFLHPPKEKKSAILHFSRCRENLSLTQWNIPFHVQKNHQFSPIAARWIQSPISEWHLFNLMVLRAWKIVIFIQFLKNSDIFCNNEHQFLKTFMNISILNWKIIAERTCCLISTAFWVTWR